MATAAEKIEAMVGRINEADLPIFDRTVFEIINVSDDDESSIGELSRVVLQDTTMTARVLKLANTIRYNPGGQKINTVSRAIVHLGVEAVRTLGLTVALVDAFVRSDNRQFLLRELARSLHAAAQARSFAEAMGERNLEEVFVAALLYNLGEMAVLCFADREARLVNDAVQQGIAREAVEKTILGYRLHDLTRRLVSSWRLNDLLEKTLDEEAEKPPLCRLIVACHQLAIAAEKGWESDEVARVLKELKLITQISLKQSRRMLYENVVQAARISHLYGATEALKLIPPPVSRRKTTGPDDATLLEYDLHLQLDILREITALLFEKRDFNLLMGMVLEGIYRGLGMDRACFALLSPDRSLMKAKFVLGRNKDLFSERFRFNLTSEKAKIFKHVIDKSEGAWMGKPGSDLNEKINNELIAQLGGMAFFVMPVVVGSKPIGVLYADRIPSGRALDEQSFANFMHFSQQASLGLEHISLLK